MTRKSMDEWVEACRAAGGTWTLVHYDAPWTHNRERQMYHYARAALVDEWRHAFAMLAREARVPPQERIAVTVEPHYARTTSRPDVGACAGAAKAAVDGIADARVIPDDTPDHLVSLTFLQPVMGAPRNALHVTIEVVE